jgi:hypothetical protein
MPNFDFEVFDIIDINFKRASTKQEEFRGILTSNLIDCVKQFNGYISKEYLSIRAIETHDVLFGFNTVEELRDAYLEEFI